MTVPSEPVVERITLKEAIKLARGKPEKGFTRNDLLVLGGWLNSGWAWSRDVNVPLEKAIENSNRLGEPVKIVGALPGKKKPSRWGSFFGGGNGNKKSKPPSEADEDKDEEDGLPSQEDGQA